MPVPARQVTFTITKTNGTTPSTGTVTFKRTRQVTDGAEIYSTDLVTSTLTAGAGSVNLVPSSSGRAASQDWAITPVGTVYEVAISVDSLTPVLYFVDIPAGDTALDLKDLIPDSELPDTYEWETIGRAEFEARLAGVTAGAALPPLYGAGVPAVGLGSNNQQYTNQTTGGVYVKVSGSWTLIVDNVLAAEVPALVTDEVTHFSAGTPSNATGKNGDLALDTTNSILYKKVSGVYAVQWTSPAGGGTTILSGSTAPVAGTGSNGNYYLKTSAPQAFYGPKAAGAWPTGITFGDEAPPGVTYTATYGATGPTGYHAFYDPTNSANFYQVPTSPASRNYFVRWIRNTTAGNPDPVSNGWMAAGEEVKVVAS